MSRSRPRLLPSRTGARPRARTNRFWLAAIALATIAVAVATLVGPRVRYGPVVGAPSWATGVREGRLSSAYCISCHQEAGEAWRGSLHQLANHEVTPTRPGAWFNGQTASTFASDYTFVHDPARGAVIRETRRDRSVHEHVPSMMIAYGTLRQFLIGDATGRFQTTEVAWDPKQQEWFGVFGDEERNPGEWGHWTGQSMNWNSMCARCHMTAYSKQYDEHADRYGSTWVEHGVGCVQCHGPMTGHEKGGRALARVDNISRDPARMIQTCAACHARAEDLTASAPPGAAFEDHFRLQLMTEPRFYHADGQILDEVFEWGSFRHSRMAAAGVTCLDCHNAHTGKTRLPVENNALCMQCHAAGNQRNAPVIDPVAHSFHKPGSTGNRCVECHMVETTYMQRDPRRDHGFIIPDPLLRQELGVPDACSRCHNDKPIAWNIEAWEKWYGATGKAAPRRARTRAVTRAHSGDVSVVPELLALIAAEKTAGWRASLLELAGQLAPGDPAVAGVARELSGDPDSLIRATAVRALARQPSAQSSVRAALDDPVRLVRLDAAWALSTELADGSTVRRELDEYLDVSIENPIALMRRGQDRFRRGLQAKGIDDLRQAIALDPLSSPLPESLGFMLNAAGRPAEAAGQLERAAELAPLDPAPAYFSALAWAEAGDPARAEAQLREAVRREPGYARAWYNLGLLLHEAGRTPEALEALATAERQTPADPDIPYAIATVLAQGGRRDEAIAAVRRALAVEPRHQPAAQLLHALQGGSGR